MSEDTTMRPNEPGEHECGADVAAYALGALDPTGAERFAEHLRGCAICRDELQAFRAVVDVLPLTAPPAAPRPALKRSVMAAVAADQKLAAAAASPEPVRRPGRWAALLPSPRLGLALAVVLAAVLIGGGLALQPSGTPHTRLLSAQVIGAPGTARIRITGDRAELEVVHFAQPPAGHIYEVWLVRPGHKPAPTNALFGVRRNGSGDVDIPGSMRGVTAMMVTPEPTGGSQTPTAPPVIRAQFS